MLKSFFSLFRGKIQAVVNKLNRKSSFEIHTPTAICGVRGTEFTVDAMDDDASEINVLDGEVEAMARKLRALPPFAVNHTKMALNLAMRQMAGAAYQTSHAWEIQSFNTEDFQEATRAFMEKREGVYTGR